MCGWAQLIPGALSQPYMGDSKGRPVLGMDMGKDVREA